MKLYEITDRYINYLRSFDELKIVMDNKENNRIHTRKHLNVGVLLNKGQQRYFIPLSSPKKSDYLDIHKNIIRNSTHSIIRMIGSDNRLLGKLQINNMIPVPQMETELFDIYLCKNLNYKNLLNNQYSFIKDNSEMIRNRAKRLYNQKINADKYFKDNKPKYIEATVDFKFAEEKCKEWEQKHIEKVISEYDKRQKEIDIER